MEMSMADSIFQVNSQHNNTYSCYSCLYTGMLKTELKRWDSNLPQWSSVITQTSLYRLGYENGHWRFLKQVHSLLNILSTQKVGEVSEKSEKGIIPFAKVSPESFP